MSFAKKHQFRLTVAMLAMFLATFCLTAKAEAARPSPFNQPGMWIWYVSSSQGGKPANIIKRARKSGIKTLYIKSGDGTNKWRQFNKHLLNRFHRAGLKVCGWQYVYGRHPGAEARVSAAAKRRGADCFVIDAEAEYEGNYSGADHYIRALRRRVGRNFPVGLSSFPYTDYHPGFPYSVFLGPGAATYNLPQIYWKAIGDRVRESVNHTWYWNDLYERPIEPVGQTYQNPSRKELMNFRRYTENYGAAPSWWSWQETRKSAWRTLARPTGGGFPRYREVTDKPTLQRGDRGDQVVWMQQYLTGAGFDVPITGIFGGGTRRSVKRFQRSRGLDADAVVGTQTWNRLLKVKPVRVRWYSPPKKKKIKKKAKKRVKNRIGRHRWGGVTASSVEVPRQPLSADLPAVRNELAGAGESGRH